MPENLMSEIIKLIVWLIVIAAVIFILWLLSEGYVGQAVDFVVENPWETMIIIIVLFFFLAFLSLAWRKIRK